MIPGFGFLSKKKEKRAAPAETLPVPSAPPIAPAPSAEERISARPQPYLLNLGCGSCFHPDWVNLDFVSNSPDVIAFDLRKPLPLADNSAAVVYHSHVLEHFRRDAARHFLLECRRVLQPGGILRVVVPDLEMIARLYLQNLDEAAEGDLEAAHRHQWMTIEMVDQLSREESGGEMLNYWKQNPMPAENFVVQRMGREVLRFLEYFRSTPEAAKPSAPPSGSLSPGERAGVRAIPPRSTDDLPEKVGAFRLSGEAHKWMYDRVSLKLLLEETGFDQAHQCQAAHSAIPDFHKYGLDLHTDGGIRKPDSLFMEAIKPPLS